MATTRRLHALLLFIVTLWVVNGPTQAQLTLPRMKVVKPGCLAADVEACRMGCPIQYHDSRMYLCPCYSKLGQCLVRIGCSMKQKIDVYAFCTRKGYCKDGYCKYREGDLSPRVDIRPEVFALTSVETPGTPCVDNCCPPFINCAQNTSMVNVRSPSRRYRNDEVQLPPRQGDPRLGVNQNYDRMPYSIPMANLP
ncbi:hypothetical protein Poli38472_010300 [Pythium oligandrum]|uniref:Secreted protein n=1 Tax=Pythium oligandrum TaxID=41045 RepID=A0A8K1FDU5_PYTOL|nr:hypothetical protein Poli38472_010300 [Pythium oligandrum]|eukprot:TMW58741.1 hypothetical protein Poli38472_010300 [Pythium oligandrum]